MLVSGERQNVQSKESLENIISLSLRFFLFSTIPMNEGLDEEHNKKQNKKSQCIHYIHYIINTTSEPKNIFTLLSLLLLTTLIQNS